MKFTHTIYAVKQPDFSKRQIKKQVSSLERTDYFYSGRRYSRDKENEKFYRDSPVCCF
ncbi:hypothetical protein DOK80_002377 [Enterococcus sp. DIV0849a]